MRITSHRYMRASDVPKYWGFPFRTYCDPYTQEYPPVHVKTQLWRHGWCPLALDVCQQSDNDRRNDMGRFLGACNPNGPSEVSYGRACAREATRDYAHGHRKRMDATR